MTFATDARARAGEEPGLWRLECRQMEAGDNPSSRSRIRLNGLELACLEFPRRTLVHGEPPSGIVGLAVADAHDAELRFRGQRAYVDTVVFGAPPKVFDASVKGRILTFAVSHDLIEHRIGHAALRGALERHRVALPMAAAARLRSLARNALKAFGQRPDLFDAPLACASLRDQMAGHLAVVLKAASQQPPPREEPGRLEAARLAHDYAMQNLDKPIAVSDLIEKTHVSERTLRAGFLDRFGHSPKAHLTVLRLNAARSLLMGSAGNELSVRDVATKSGFWHLGRFAASYRRHFGELPSETRRKTC